MTETIRILAALLAVISTAGFLAIRDRVCHALRITCAALVVMLAGFFYSSSIVVSCGAFGIALGSLAAIVRTSLLRQRPQSGARHETLY
ncbi:MAG: hypothetical protein QM758_06835 [Armatimonas sp.]